MSGTITPNLGLFNTNMLTDGDDFFDFDRDLNRNNNKIDAFAGKVSILNYNVNDTFKKDVVVKDIINGVLRFYISLTDENVGNPLTDGTKWKEVLCGGSGYQMFDIVMKDHVLSYEETLGLAQLGTYVYKEAIAGSRYGYPDFYQKCLDEYNESTSQSEYASSNYVQMVGTITDNEGVLSGFSNGNYILCGYINIPADATWEYVTKFNSSDHSTLNILGGFGNEGMHSLSTDINTDGTLSVFITSNSTNWDIANGVRSSLTLNDNTDYYMKRYFTGTEYKIDISTTGAFSGEETNYITVSSTTSIFSTNCPVDIAGWMNSGTFTGFRGTIDLNGCYININGERWWTGTNRLNYKQFTNKHRFYDIANKSYFDNMYAITGEAWYYGIDTTNERIFLPRSTRFRNGTSSDVGGYQAAGLPNITGTTSAGQLYNNELGITSGAFRVTGSGYSYSTGGRSNYKDLSFDASRSSSIYGASDTVEYSSTKLIPYIVVGNQSTWSGMTDVVNQGMTILSQVNAGLATKLDLDLTNITNSTKSTIAGYAMPSDTYEDLVLGASGSTYTAPANGWFCLYRIPAVGYSNIENLTTGFMTETRNTVNGAGNGVWASVRKNDIIKLTYDGGTNVAQWRFYYAEGSESEAS